MPTIFHTNPVSKYLLAPWLVLMLCVFCCTLAQNTLLEKVKQQSNGNGARAVDMARISIPDWDHLFVFKTCASLELINSKIGFQYPYFDDVGSRVVFIKGNTVVFHEDYFPQWDIPNEQELHFSLPDSVCYAVFTPKNATFLISNTVVRGKKIYLATPAN